MSNPAMKDFYLFVGQAVQVAAWRGYKVRCDNGRYYATDESSTFYLRSDNDGRSYYWAMLSQG